MFQGQHYFLLPKILRIIYPIDSLLGRFQICAGKAQKGKVQKEYGVKPMYVYCPIETKTRVISLVSSPQSIYICERFMGIFLKPKTELVKEKNKCL